MGGPLLGWTDALLGRWRFGWTPVSTGESGDLVCQRDDRLAYAKLAPTTRSAELAGERDRLTWLDGQGISCPKVIDWQEAEEGACLVMSAIPGIAAAELSAPELLKAWPSIARQLSILHELAADRCPFDRGLSLMFERAVDVVARNAVNPDFLPDEDKDAHGSELLTRIASEVSVRRDQEDADKVVCHGDPCMPNFMVDPQTVQCTGVIDLGRLGTADRYADLALILANAGETWTTPDQSEQARAILFDTLGIVAPDQERLAFYLRLDPLTWG